MAYGITVKNNSGRTTIDETSRQVQVIKSGSIYPKPIAKAYSSSLNPFRFGGSQNPQANCVIVPGDNDESILFFRPRKTNNSVGGSQILHVGVQYGTTTIQWTSTSATTVGTNFVYASYTTSTPVMQGVQSYIGNSYAGIINDDPTVDTIGSVVGYYGNWASGNTVNTPARIVKVETTSTSGVYKVTLDGTWTSSLSSGTQASSISKNVVWFYTPNDSGFVANANYGTTAQSAWTLDYKFGKLTEEAEETSGYGLEVYKSDGKLAFSSNRVNFQIESITTGLTDLQAHASSTGSYAYSASTPSPVIHATVDDTSNYADYYVMLTGSGNTAAFVKGNNNNGAGSYPHAFSWGVGYAFCPVGGGDFMNATMAGPAGGDQVDTVSIGSSNGGMSMSPIYQSLNQSAPQINQYAYVQDTWAVEATRSLVIGKFV